MKPQRNICAVGGCLALLSLLVLCDTATARPPGRGIFIRSGPPAHAPAYGYRNKQLYGFELVFDVGVGMYVAVGMTDVYYHEGYFYRLHAGVWEISLRGVTWEPVVTDKLPPGLQIKAKTMIKLNGNGNGLVKLNGNGPNGNAAGNADKSNGAAAAQATGPQGATGGKANSPADGNTNKSSAAADTSVGKVNGPAAGGVSKPAGSAAANAGKSGSDTGGSVSKPTGSVNSTAGKPNASPDGNRKTKPTGKGKKK